MKKEEKNTIIDSIVQRIQNKKHFYIADTGSLNANDTSKLRRKCFEQKIELVVVKNTLLKKALEKLDGNYEELYDILINPTSLMLSESPNSPARMIKEFRRVLSKPILKAAYVEESIYLGDDQLDILANLKTKDELVGDIISLLQSPSKNVISALLSGKNKLAGVIKTLSER